MKTDWSKCEKAEHVEDPIVDEKLGLIVFILEGFRNDTQIGPEAEYEILSKLIEFSKERQTTIWNECMDAVYEEMPKYGE